MKAFKTIFRTFSLFAIVLAGCTSSKSPAEVRPIDEMEVTGLLNNDFATFLDVREEAGEKSGILARARHIPLSKLDSQIAELPKGKLAIVTCSTVECAKSAAQKIATTGVKAAYLIPQNPSH